MKSKYFRRAEFACRCGCGFDSVDTETLGIIEAVREHFDVPVKITSASRCPAYNADVGGSAVSQHMKGRACDIQVQGVEPSVVAAYVETLLLGAGGLGRYKTFTHVDTRTGRPWRG